MFSYDIILKILIPGYETKANNFYQIKVVITVLLKSYDVKNQGSVFENKLYLKYQWFI